MPTRLTASQQRTLLSALPSHRINAARKHCYKCQMKGDGLMDIVKSVGKVLGPIAKEVGPVVMKQFVLPMIEKKIAGKGLSPAGGALKLAGQGHRRKGPAKGSPAMKAKMARLRAMRR